jgi:diguanylate cyclase (GGDEF)-like protein
VRHRTGAVAVITVAALGVVGVFSAISIQRSYDSGLASEGAKLAATAQVTAALISQQMASVEDIERATLQRSGFITAIGSGAAGTINTPGLQLILNEVQAPRPEFQFAAFADALGTSRATAPLNPAVIERDFSFRDWYRVDVDDLKRSTTATGHEAGDELLVKLSTVLSAELRPSDMLARTGGDEFVALLVDCDANGAVELGKRLKAATSRLRFAWGGPSISVGSAAGASGDAPEQIAKIADVALYAAKRASKERAGPPAALTSGRP